MSQFGAPTIRRAGGDLNVYTGLLCAAFLVLAVGVVMLVLENSGHSKVGPNDQGGPFKLIGK
jgi:hypothetical protein